MLDKFQYKRGPDGYRTLPDGKPLVIRYSSMPTERDRQFDELFKRSLDSIGVRLEIHKDRFAELNKLGHECRLMMRGAAWIADYPDGDNFMQLLYGPNTGQTNSACYRSPEFDRLYEKSRSLPDGVERNRLYREMTRLVEVHTVWMLADSRYRNVLLQPHVVGYRKHPVLFSEWLYIDLDPAVAEIGECSRTPFAGCGSSFRRCWASCCWCSSCSTGSEAIPPTCSRARSRIRSRSRTSGDSSASISRTPCSSGSS